jgi:hypothetical protein
VTNLVPAVRAGAAPSNSDPSAAKSEIFASRKAGVPGAGSSDRPNIQGLPGILTF